jgi:hypothetical protein
VSTADLVLYRRDGFPRNARPGLCCRRVVAAKGSGDDAIVELLQRENAGNDVVVTAGLRSAGTGESSQCTRYRPSLAAPSSLAKASLAAGTPVALQRACPDLPMKLPRIWQSLRKGRVGGKGRDS